MHSYKDITSQDDMEALLDSIAGFHDSMTKEIHLVNRGYVRLDKRMVMAHRFDAQILIQSQWDPGCVELVFGDVQELNVGDSREYCDATGKVETIVTPVEQRRVTMRFDSELTVVAASLSYRIRSNWLGNRAFLRTEVPSVDAIPASPLEDDWRQCSSCHDAWQQNPAEEFSYCPGCGLLTEICKL